MTAPPFGEGPFRCKGNVYLGFVEQFEKQIRGGLGGVLQRSRDETLIAFASQRFLAASWYDALPIVPIGEAAALAAGVSFARMLSDLATAQAERDIRGVYQYLLRFASPAVVVERLPRAARQYFDFVSSELLTRPARSPAELRLSQIPRDLAPTYVLMTEPFLRRALMLAGAKSVHIEVTPFESDEPAHGLPTVRFSRQISWA